MTPAQLYLKQLFEARARSRPYSNGHQVQDPDSLIPKALNRVIGPSSFPRMAYEVNNAFAIPTPNLFESLARSASLSDPGSNSRAKVLRRILRQLDPQRFEQLDPIIKYSRTYIERKIMARDRHLWAGPHGVVIVHGVETFWNPIRSLVYHESEVRRIK